MRTFYVDRLVLHRYRLSIDVHCCLLLHPEVRQIRAARLESVLRVAPLLLHLEHNVDQVVLREAQELRPRVDGVRGLHGRGLPIARQLLLVVVEHAQHVQPSSQLSRARLAHLLLAFVQEPS